MLRVIRNRSPIGKPWHVVQGRFHTNPIDFAKFGDSARKVWKTEMLVSQHLTKEQADHALVEHSPASIKS